QNESSPVKLPRIWPSTSGPSSNARKPPMTDAGRNRFCIHSECILIHLPINRKIAKYINANPICSGLIFHISFKFSFFLSSSLSCNQLTEFFKRQLIMHQFIFLDLASE